MNLKVNTIILKCISTVYSKSVNTKYIINAYFTYLALAAISKLEIALHINCLAHFVL